MKIIVVTMVLLIFITGMWILLTDNDKNIN